jgi:hypothetical protein
MKSEPERFSPSVDGEPRQTPCSVDEARDIVGLKFNCGAAPPRPLREAVRTKGRNDVRPFKSLMLLVVG